VPPLRERREDIPAMARALLTVACARAGTTCKVISDSALTLLAALPWRGNLLELREAARRLASASGGGEIDVRDVLPHVEFDAAIASSRAPRTLRAARRQFERDYICEVLQRQGGRVGDAARVLGIQRTNLYRKARQLGISVTRPEQA
jgi:two-component system nitrogen regulation response regulator NtrX